MTTNKYLEKSSLVDKVVCDLELVDDRGGTLVDGVGFVVGGVVVKGVVDGTFVSSNCSNCVFISVTIVGQFASCSGVKSPTDAFVKSLNII